MIAIAAEVTSILDRVTAKAAEVEAKRKTLPCAVHNGNREAGAAACEAAKTHDGCEFGRAPGLCPRASLQATVEEVRQRLTRARVPARERGLVLGTVTRTAPLVPTPALTAVRALLSDRRQTLELEGAKLELTGQEVLCVLGGPRGVGKTVAACYALGRTGGLYVTAYPFARPGLDLGELKAATTLVVDQLGRENVGASDYALSQLEEVIDDRYANRRLTLLCANLKRADFTARYGGVIDDRLVGEGVYVELQGKSLRGDHAQ